MSDERRGGNSSFNAIVAGTDRIGRRIAAALLITSALIICGLTLTPWFWVGLLLPAGYFAWAFARRRTS